MTAYYACTLTLNAGTNSERINAAAEHGGEYTVTLANRTLYKDGGWNTLCLPFNLTLQGSPLEGATVKTVTAASVSGTTLNLTFGNNVTYLEAGTPYIIKWTSGSDLVNPVFEGVAISSATHDFDNGESGDERVRFMGTYNQQTIDATNYSILFMGADNTLYYPNGQGTTTIGACRAYFKIGDDDAAARRLTAINIIFDGTSTGITSATDSTTFADAADSWHDLNGRKINSKPVAKGLYIHNGRKVVIK